MPIISEVFFCNLGKEKLDELSCRECICPVGVLLDFCCCFGMFKGFGCPLTKNLSSLYQISIISSGMSSNLSKLLLFLLMSRMVCASAKLPIYHYFADQRISISQNTPARGIIAGINKIDLKESEIMMRCSSKCSLIAVSQSFNLH